MSTLVFVGGGPRTTGILLRLAANAAVTPEDHAISEIHVIDPFPAGGGRIWRRQQSGLLWMNSMAEDVTIFADDSVNMVGPVIPGPRLDEWVLGVGREDVVAAGLANELDGFTGRTFPSRRLQSLYLGWVFAEAVQRLEHLPVPIPVHVHETEAIEVIDVDDRQAVRLADGGVITADVVVLTQGHLDVRQSAESSALGSIAATEGLSYVPPGFTADQDLSVLPAAERVLVRGFGLAFIDAMVLLTEGRGGQYVSKDGILEYLASGNEPELWVGSRRGVPYLPKLSYAADLHAEPIQFLDDESLAQLSPGELSYHNHIFPLLKWNLRFTHYAQLLNIDPDRALVDWQELSQQLLGLLPPELGGAADHRLVEEYLVRVIPDPDDRFDFDALDRPLSGLSFHCQDDLQTHLATYTARRLERAANSRFSMDQAVFFALIQIYVRIHALAKAGRFSLVDLRENVDRALHSLFSYIASGPPPERLEQLLALHRAGIVNFLGPDIRIGVEDGLFTASSPAVEEVTVRARGLIDAYLADDAASAVDDELLQRLLREGDVTVESPAGPVRGKFVVDGAGRPLRSDGSVHPSRYLLGPMVSGGGSEAPFSRPGTNAPGFQRADQLARRLLGLASEVAEDFQLATASRHPD